jgi:TrkA domain protein
VSADVTQDELPGIGRRFEVRCEDGGILTIVVYNNGRRDLYAFSPGSGEPCVVTMLDDQARAVGEIMSGSFADPAEVGAARGVREAFDDLAFDWVGLDPGSPGTERSIGDLAIRSRTGATVMSIVRGHGVIHDPAPEEVLRAGDRLVVAGRRDRLPEVRRLLAGPPAGWTG